MKFGTKHEFHFLDLIGDAVKTTWQGRHAIDWSIIARRLVKLTILALTIIAMTYVLYPTQKRGWLLWLGTEQAELAHWTAVSLVGFTAVIIPGFRYAWEHGHKILASVCSFFAVALLSTVLMGTWNFYSFASSRAVATSLAATGGAGARIQEATRRLSQLDEQSGQEIKRFDAELARTPASYASARARILRAQTEARQAATTERAALQAELKEARALNVTVNTTVADPRPIDQFISNTLRTERTGTGVALDLWRSLVFELAALIGVALATTLSNAGSGSGAVRTILERAPIDPARTIEDLRTQPRVKVQAYEGMKTRVFDGETGEEEVYVKGHIRRKKAKGKAGEPQPATVETPPISLPDETGVQLERDSRVARLDSTDEIEVMPPSRESVPQLETHFPGELLQPENARELSEHAQSQNDNSDDQSSFGVGQNEPSLFGEYDEQQYHDEPSAEREEEQTRQLAHDLTDEELALLAEEELEKA